MKDKVLQNGRLLPALEAALAQRHDVHPLWRESDPAAFLERHGGDFRGYIASARHGADAAMVAALPNVRVISIFGVGLDAVDLDVVLLPHIASNTPETRQARADLALANLDSFFRTGAVDVSAL